MSTTPSSFQTTGLSIAYSDSILKSERSDFLGRLTKDIGSYQHTIAAFGGYKSANITISGNQQQLEDWFAMGLGRDIEVHDSSLDVVWNGFVNSISLNLGALSATSGPLLDIANRTSVNYARILNANTNPPVVGNDNTTIIAEDTTSQEKYGIVEKVLSGGTSTKDDAERFRDTHLLENSNPQTSETINLSGSSQASITLECLGYYEWFKVYTYDASTTGTSTLSTKLQAVITADPNSIFSTDFSNITTNSYLTVTEESDDALANVVIQNIVALGDVNDNRYLFGIYDDRKVKYNPIPDTEKYQHKLTDPNQRVTDLVGNTIEPWEVLPGEWLFFPDFLVGKSQPTNRRLDPRFLFIEEVGFSAPDGLTISGSKVSTIPQLLAKKGLGGSTA